VLDSTEVSNSFYLCNGANGAPGAGPPPDAGTVSTTLNGTVYAPNGTDPVYGARVFVPSTQPLPFTAGVTPQRCTDLAPIAPLADGVTDALGHFSISGTFSGAAVPLVVQIGRWRRQVTVPNVVAGASVVVSPSLTHLPRAAAEGDIPLTAIVTGVVDAVECVFRKMGIADSEFTQPSNGGRFQLYVSSIGTGASFGPSTPKEDVLWGSDAALSQYDAVVFDCPGAAYAKTADAQQRLINYANAGGRVLADHDAYVWLYNDPPFSSTASWNVEQAFPQSPTPVQIKTSTSRGAALAEWLSQDPASPSTTVTLGGVRHDLSGVVAPSLEWISVSSFGDAPLQFTFDTPVGAPGSQVGRVLFTDYHASPATSQPTFPQECSAGPMTPDEKILEFSIFDLENCIDD
jgi:hypothetical protein